MAVVVTGAAGFVGTALCAALTAAGYDVVGVDRRAGATLRADLSVADPVVADALRTAEAVFHLAGRPGVRDPLPDAGRLRHRDNVVATARVLAQTPLATPVVVTSSSSVYGGARGRGCREADPLLPRGGYARSKVAVEALCARRAAAGGRVAVARPFTVAGEGQRPDMALARWIAAARAGLPVEVYGSVTRSRDVTDVRDVARALIAMAERDVSGAVNVGTGVAHRLCDLLAAVTAAVGTPVAVRVVPAADEEVPDTLADTARCARLLGFVPSTDLPALVARQAAAGLPAEALVS